MQVSLTPEMQRFVADKIESGQYRTPEEVVNGALAALKAQETHSPDDVEELRRLVTVGIAQLDRGDGAPWDSEALKSRVRDRVAREKRAG